MRGADLREGLWRKVELLQDADHPVDASERTHTMADAHGFSHQRMWVVLAPKL